MGEARRRRQAGDAALDALLARGRALQRGGTPREALACYARVLRSQPEHPDALHLSGLAFIELGELQAALSHLSRAAAVAPGDAGLRHNLGRAQMMAAQLDAALQSFCAAIKADPGHAGAHFQRARILETLGRTEEAAEAFLAAARADPKRVLAHVGASRQLYRLDRIGEAIESQQRAAALDPRILEDGRIGAVRARSSPDRAAQASHAAARCEPGPAVGSRDALVRAALERELVIIDDALVAPEAVRDFALSLPYVHHGGDPGTNYPGRQTRGGYDSAEIDQRIADALGRDLKWGWPGHGAFRLTAAGSAARSDIHVDHDDSRPAYAAVLYLSLPEHCQGGTSFWRHRGTAWERLPRPGAKDPDVDAFLRRQRRSDAIVFEDWRRDDWDLVLAVPMRFNRLVVYRSDYFHAVSRAFGTGPEDARLVQLFFYEPLGQAAPGGG